MRTPSLRVPFACVVAVALGSAATASLADNLSLVAPLGGNMNVPTVSMKQARFISTLRQQYDFSCGSAAVATLLSHHYGQKVDEATVFQAMFERGNRDKIRREGFSMLDMKLYLDGRGFNATGVEASLDELGKANVPAIALINESGYAHFVVIKGLRQGEVLIGDPAAGTRVVPRKDFERYWMNNILLVVSNRIELARFNQETDWRVRPKAPLRSGVDDGGFDMQLLQQRSLVDF
ncbi:C39 family peptidase [Thauera sinica]|uniref:C39 family peptidase n=1 Tax=Thauera sinica TaxID=2665146 RepID=A0ABW1AXW6_9RHOO|nr:C39 family peptidase [Thauera sp. K11]ATE58901.1 peptidase C39 [Thauera sp. K11]